MIKQPDLSWLKSKHRFLIIKPIEIAVWILLVGVAVLILTLPISWSEKARFYFFLGTSILYTVFIFYWMIPNMDRYPRMYLVSLTAAALFVAWAQLLFAPFQIYVVNFYIILIIFAGLIGSRYFTMFYVILSTLATFILDNRNDSPLLESNISNLVFDFLLYALTGVAANVLGNVLHRVFTETSRKNSELSLLVEINQTITSTNSSHPVLSEVVFKICHALPITYCGVFLLDHPSQRLIIHRAYPGFDPDHTPHAAGEIFELDQFPLHSTCINNGELAHYRKQEILDLVGKDEHRILCLDKYDLLTVIPLISKQITWGTLTIGEEQSGRQQPFSLNQLDLLTSIAKQVALTIQNDKFNRNLENQLERLAVLHEVSQAISQTIEIDDLLELIYRQISRVLPSDTYFVALYIPEQNVNDIRILIDEGVNYPQIQTQADKGLASWLLNNRQPLLIHHLINQQEELGLDPIQIGEDKISLSWLGVPLIAENEYIGLLAVASYSPYVYDEEDKMLLQQFAGHAALTINNARQHARVKEQARRDSLTGVYNHSHLIQTIHTEVERAAEHHIPVSLIMMDIDRFKRYNDTYGHIIGDRVLRMTVQAIQSNVKRTDTIGRWGGEEFGIVLPNASITQAVGVAERIRKTLQELDLRDSDGNSIPKPTISQGIATYPVHTTDVDMLIRLADQALFAAKDKGRDKIAIHNQEDEAGL